MRERLAVLLIAGSFALGGCREPTSVVPADPQTFRLPYGTTYNFPDGTAITFVQLLGDSRCPHDFECFWEGQAQIALRLRNAGQEEVARPVVSGGVTRADSTRAETVMALGHAIQLLQLDPYPVSGGSVGSTRYVAHLRVTRIER